MATQSVITDEINASGWAFVPVFPPRLVNVVPALYLTLEDPTELKFGIRALYAVFGALRESMKAAGHGPASPYLEALWRPYHNFGDEPRDPGKRPWPSGVANSCSGCPHR